MIGPGGAKIQEIQKKSKARVQVQKVRFRCMHDDDVMLDLCSPEPWSIMIISKDAAAQDGAAGDPLILVLSVTKYWFIHPPMPALIRTPMLILPDLLTHPPTPPTLPPIHSCRTRRR
jgi:hypothetical protein